MLGEHTNKKLPAASNSRLAIKPVEIRVHCVRGDTQAPRDVVLATIVEHELRDLELAS